jgi:hypothetical protein
MKKIIASILIFCMSTMAMADSNCDWSQIKKLPDGGFEYTATLNLCVGNLVQDNKVQAQQISDLTKAIQLKDLAISYSDARTVLWQKSADDELARLNTIEKDQKHNDLLYFGLGILFTSISVYGASKLVGH